MGFVNGMFDLEVPPGLGFSLGDGSNERRGFGELRLCTRRDVTVTGHQIRSSRHV
jgi:hypothetical protein